MSDLTDNQSAQSVKIIGSDLSGVEQTPVKSTGLGELLTSDVINSGNSLESAFTVGTTAIEIKVGANRLANRKYITLYNNSNKVIYWGYTNAVTMSTGSPIAAGGFISWKVGDSQPIYVISDTNNLNTRITEGA